MKSLLRILLIAPILMNATAVLAQWTTAQPVWNPADPNESNNANGVKDPHIAGSTGGFHVTYRLFINGGAVENRYRRYSGGSLGPVKVVQSGNFTANSWIAEAGNGDVHIVYENWDGLLDVAWARSTDGGNTFSPAVDISNCTCDSTKFPGIAPFGSAGSADMIMAVADVSANHQMKYQRWNGATWSPSAAASFGAIDSEYFATGICQSLQDGSVYRTYGRKVSSNPNMYGLFYRRYNGTSWESEQTVTTTTFFAYPYIAVNPAGVVMIVWEQDSRIDSRWYTPGTGWSPVTVVEGGGNHGQVTAIPGTNHFYVVHSTNQHIIEGRYWINGQWLPKTTVSVGQPNNGASFTPTARVSAGSDRALYAAWENWDTGNSRGYFSTVTSPHIVLNPTSVSRTVSISHSPTPDTFLLTNGGPGTLNYTISSDAAWVSPTITNGSNTGQDHTITVNYSTGSLVRGNYTAHINMAGNTPSSPQSFTISLTVSVVKPDYDGDGDVDQVDFGFLQNCFGGPNNPVSTQACDSARLDADEDVDNDDLDVFLGCLSGADIVADPACDP